MTDQPPPPSSYRIPTLAHRVTVGVLFLVPLLIFLVAVPYEVLTQLAAHGVQSPLPAVQLSIAGAVISVLAFARYVAKPTRAFGPLTLAGGGFAVGYLLFFAPEATMTIHASGTAITLGYGALFLLLAVVPALTVVSGAATTIEDARHPGERLPFDFPA